jgi:ABC-type amino acid transport substrate-binding protein
MSKTSILLGLVLCAATGIAQAQSLPARILEKKTLVVANVPNYPPLEFKDPKTSKLTGLDIDLGEALGKKLKPALQIVGTEGSADARTQLRQKRLDAAVQGSETLPYLMNQEPGNYAILGTPFTSVYQGLAFAKKDTELRDAVAKAFTEMLADGSYAAVLQKWELADAKVDKLMINGETKN